MIRPLGKKKRERICPRCGGQRIPILYGMPVPDKKLRNQLRCGEVYLGGCAVNSDRRFHCNTCEGRQTFGDDPDGEADSPNVG